jgi:aspartate/methionine/tyrosine aminotransferase
MALKVGKGAHAPPFIVMDVIAAVVAREAGRAPTEPRTIRMEVGQPGTGAPKGAADAVMRALQGGATMGYTEIFGIASLRERISRHYADWYGVAVPAARIAVTVGASGAFPLAFLAAFDPGDRVAMAAPFYPPYANVLTALGMHPALLPCDASTRYQPTVAMLERLDPRPAGLVVASPGNPAGTMLAPAEFAAIAAWCAASQVRLISDEIYHGLQYGQALSTAAGLDDAIVVNSFSKYWSMTGWRIGWLVLPEALVRPVERLAANLFISAPHVAQVAAEAAMDCAPELDANVARYRRNRDLLLRELPLAGFDRLSPAEGAFYIYADVAHRTNDSVAFCARMLAECGIAATPGIDFDPDRGRHFLRFSYCGPEDDMAEAARRLRQWGG